MSDIAASITSSAGPKLIQKRLDMSSNSGLGRSSNVTIFGSSAMPQIGHAPGAFSRTSGSIGQTYSTVAPVGTVVGVVARCAGGTRNAAGSLRNFTKHPGEQK